MGRLPEHEYERQRMRHRAAMLGVLLQVVLPLGFSEYKIGYDQIVPLPCFRRVRGGDFFEEISPTNLNFKMLSRSKFESLPIPTGHRRFIIERASAWAARRPGA